MHHLELFYRIVSYPTGQRRVVNETYDAETEMSESRD